MKIRTKTVRYGRNRDDEDSYVRCARCGFICNSDRDIRKSDGDKSGWGIAQEDFNVEVSATYSSEFIQYSSTFVEYSNSSIARTIQDPKVVSGCPQCGCLLY